MYPKGHGLPHVLPSPPNEADQTTRQTNDRPTQLWEHLDGGHIVKRKWSPVDQILSLLSEKSKSQNDLNTLLQRQQ